MKISIKQILLEGQIHINDLDKKVGYQQSNKILSNLHQQKFGSTLNDDIINNWRSNSNITFNHLDENPNNINGFIRTKTLRNDDENSKYYHALESLTKRNPNAINYISDLASIEKGTGKALLNNLPNTNPIVLRAWNKDLIPYYKAHGFQQLIHPEIRGKMNMYKLNEEQK